MDLEEIKKIAKEHMEKNDLAHGWNHTERVYNLCIKIGEKEGADLEVLKLAALLHDIGINRDRKNHEKVSAEMTKDILQGYSKLEDVLYCIESHRFSKGIVPKTLEAKILQDADRLDVLGAMGIIRTMTYTGHVNRPVHIPGKSISHVYTGESDSAVDHIYEKLMKIKDRMNTRTGKKIAEKRHEFVENFMSQFFAEWDGER